MHCPHQLHLTKSSSSYNFDYVEIRRFHSMINYIFAWLLIYNQIKVKKHWVKTMNGKVIKVYKTKQPSFWPWFTWFITDWPELSVITKHTDHNVQTQKQSTEGTNQHRQVTGLTIKSDKTMGDWLT